MSAYIVEKNHVIYLVAAALNRRIGQGSFSWYHTDAPNSADRSKSLGCGDYEKAAEVANMLWRENIASVSDRYPGESSATLPGPVDETFDIKPNDFCHRFALDRFDPVQVLKSCCCFSYQSCEHSGWKTSEAFAFIRSLEQSAVRSLPGWEEAEWGAPSGHELHVVRVTERETAASDHAAEVARIAADLQKKYPWARPMGKGSEHARAAANLRKELSLAFPGIKFSVSSKSFSGGDSVSYKWELGPTSNEVEAIANKYQEGSFNGMEDIYEHDRSAFSAAVSEVLGQAKYVHGSRGASEQHAVVALALCDELKVERPADGKSFWNCVVPDRNGPREDIGCLTRQIILQQSYPPGAVLTGLEQNDKTSAIRFSEFWRVTFTTPSTAAALNGASN